jgi:hypothetical protein
MDENPYRSPADRTDPLAEGAVRRGLARKAKFSWVLAWMIAATTCEVLLMFGPIIAGVAVILLIVVAWLGSVAGRL